MTWIVEFSKLADKQFSKLDNATKRRIADFIADRLCNVDNPRTLGHALTGTSLGDYWRFRVGDYRLVCDIQDRRLIILVVDIGHRSRVYR